MKTKRLIGMTPAPCRCVPVNSDAERLFHHPAITRSWPQASPLFEDRQVAAIEDGLAGAGAKAAS